MARSNATLMRLLHLLQHLASRIGLLLNGNTCQLLSIHSTLPVSLSISVTPGTSCDCPYCAPFFGLDSNFPYPPLFLLFPVPNIWVHTLPPIPPLTLMSPSVAPRLLTVEFSISVIYLGIPIALSHLFASTPLGPYAPLVPLLGEAPPGLIGLNSPWLKPILNSDYTELS